MKLHGGRNRSTEYSLVGQHHPKCHRIWVFTGIRGLEMNLGFILTVDSEELGLKAGQKIPTKGVALQHWREETDEGSGKKVWKI